MIHDGPSFDAKWLSALEQEELESELAQYRLANQSAAQSPSLLSMFERKFAELWKRITGK